MLNLNNIDPTFAKILRPVISLYNSGMYHIEDHKLSNNRLYIKYYNKHTEKVIGRSWHLCFFALFISSKHPQLKIDYTVHDVSDMYDSNEPAANNYKPFPYVDWQGIYDHHFDLDMAYEFINWKFSRCTTVE